MQTQLNITSIIQLSYLKYMLLIVLLLGIFFRGFNLDKKVYWRDEALTSLAIAGYTGDRAWQDLGGREISTEDLQNYQRINPAILYKAGEYMPLV